MINNCDTDLVAPRLRPRGPEDDGRVLLAEVLELRVAGHVGEGDEEDLD
jgi:hypothetical protein